MSAQLGLITPRLLMPPISPPHRDDLVRLYSDPDVARYIGGDLLTDEIVGMQIETFSSQWTHHGWGVSAVIERATNRFVGRAGLFDFAEWNEVELGFIFAASAQGRGLATEAAYAWIDRARDLGIDRLISSIHPDNHASMRLSTKLGFTFAREDTTPSGFPTLIYERQLSTS